MHIHVYCRGVYGEKNQVPNVKAGLRVIHLTRSSSASGQLEALGSAVQPRTQSASKPSGQVSQIS